MELIGDIHGNFNFLRERIEHSREKILIQVGDFGLGFRREEYDIQTLDSLDYSLGEAGKQLFIIRGNHDDPKFWNGKYRNYEYLHLIPDTTILHLDGERVLFIGGALSIDRVPRGYISKRYNGYWPDEAFDYDEDNLRKQLEYWEGVDIVVTHTAPSFAFPRGFNRLVHSFAEDDPTLLDELKTEREVVDRVYNIVCEYGKPSHWIYGHYHQDIKEEIYETKFILLGIDSTINL